MNLKIINFKILMTFIISYLVEIIYLFIVFKENLKYVIFIVL